MLKKQKGFTLIELLIVIAIIAIIASVVFVALDPLTRFRDSRDASRWTDVSALISAIKIDQVDNGGTYVAAIETTAIAGQVYLLGTCGAGATAVGVTDHCDTNPTQAICLDISALVGEGYLGGIPVSPEGTGTWGVAMTGYTLQKDTSGIVHIRACESENSDPIAISR